MRFLDKVHSVMVTSRFVTTIGGLQLTLGAAAVILTVAGVTTGVAEISRDKSQTTVTLSDRISVLVENLEDSAAAISEIEEEVQAREALVADLEEKQRTSEEIVKLSQSEVEAVSQLLGEEITANRSFWDTTRGKFALAFTSGGVLFFLGIAFDHWVIPWIRRQQREPSTTPPPEP